MLTVVTIGGFLLIFGAIFMYFGKVYYSAWMYVFADICWVINAFQRGDTFGSIVVLTGLILGSLTMYKMHVGIFHKQITK